jgi:CheY-like chemotaxis protein
MTSGAVILVVDDNRLNLELATDILEAAGYGVRQAASGPEAMALVKAEPPGLILMDIGLPGMDGYAVLDALRADPGTAAIPVVALTAYAMAGDEQRALAAGFDEYITKPIDTKGLPRAVARLLAGKGGG